MTIGWIEEWTNDGHVREGMDAALGINVGVVLEILYMLRLIRLLLRFFFLSIFCDSRVK